MCRIVGFWDFNYKGSYDIEKTITLMRDTLYHGGPDAGGNFVEKEDGLAFGHRRLSILDVTEKGNQPMEYSNLVIIYNGEIYNYRTIKKELIKYGYQFFSDSDTEVILKAYYKWGVYCLEKFKGFFSFALWQKKEKTLFLFRDRMGIKPLYWYFNDGLFIFSSELKSFHMHPNFKKELNEIALALYLQYGYIPAPYSIYKNVFKLMPGCYMEIKNNNYIKTYSYWSLEKAYKRALDKRVILEQLDEEEVARELEQRLEADFNLRLVSHVPVGIFLSGGIDSSLLSALLQKTQSKPLKTFTIGFSEEKYNEAPYAKNVAKYLGTEHHEYYCSPKDMVETISKIPYIYDEPFGDSSCIPTYIVSRFARQYVKVSLSADGGDEQYFGYKVLWKRAKYLSRLNYWPIKLFIKFMTSIFNAEIAFRVYKKLNMLFPKYDNFLDKWKKLNYFSKNNVICYDLLIKIFLEDELYKLGLKNTISIRDIFKLDIKNYQDEIMIFLLKTYLIDDLLVKVDRASMSVSLEAREPFLDHETIEYAMAIPPKLKINRGINKYILKKILYKYLPKNLIDRPKKGFAIPIKEWFKKELKSLYFQYLNYDRIKKEKVFDPEFVKEMLEGYLNDRGVNYVRLWYIFIFELWKERWLE